MTPPPAEPSTPTPPAHDGSAASSRAGRGLTSPGSRLPDFPWDRLIPFKAQASAHPDGLVDLSVGTPVDPTPRVVQRALRAAADSPGYPTVWGPPSLRAAIIAYLTRRCGSIELTDDCVLPTVGSK